MGPEGQRRLVPHNRQWPKGSSAHSQAEPGLQVGKKWGTSAPSTTLDGFLGIPSRVGVVFQWDS